MEKNKANYERFNNSKQRTEERRIPGRREGGWREEQVSHQQLDTLVSHVTREHVGGHPALSETNRTADRAVLLLHSGQRKKNNQI